MLKVLAQYLTDSELVRAHRGGLQDSSLASPSYEPASVSTAMGQDICWVKAPSAYRAKPSVRCRHGLLLGFSFSISISQDQQVILSI